MAVSTVDGIEKNEIKYIAGFDVTFTGSLCICACAVFEAKTLKLVEKKSLITKTQMNYLPGFAAFREGPIMCQLYYDLEHDPDVILVEGHGISHPARAGLASFVGVTLNKPAIGIVKNVKWPSSNVK